MDVGMSCVFHHLRRPTRYMASPWSPGGPIGKTDPRRFFQGDLWWVYGGFMVGLWWVYGDQWVIHLVGDWAYPSEQILEWVSSVGMLTFPTEWKVVKFHGSKPPTRYHPCYIFGLEWLNLLAHDTFLVVATSPSWLWEPPQWLVYGYNVRPPFDS